MIVRPQRSHYPYFQCVQEYARITMLVALHIKLVKIKRKNFPVDGLFSVECPVRKNYREKASCARPGLNRPP